MVKLMLLSSIIMTVLLPIRAARVTNPHRGLRRAAASVLAFNILYWFVVLIAYFMVLKGSDPKALVSH